MTLRGIIGSDAQRKPGASLSATAKAEIHYLLSRVARTDARANLAINGTKTFLPPACRTSGSSNG